MSNVILSYIIAIVFGLLIGNFTTTILYRLPHGITLAGVNAIQPPFCSVCRHPLRFYEYLPLLSWLTTLGTCNYCGCKINKIYIIIEVLTAIASAIAYSVGGFSEQYILIVIFFALIFLSIALYLQHDQVFQSITLTICILGAIYRTLIDHSITLWTVNLCIISIISISIFRKEHNYSNAFIGLTQKECMHVLLPASIWCDKGLTLCCAISSAYLLINNLSVISAIRKKVYIIFMITLALIILKLYAK